MGWSGVAPCAGPGGCSVGWSGGCSGLFGGPSGRSRRWVAGRRMTSQRPPGTLGRPCGAAAARPDHARRQQQPPFCGVRHVLGATGNRPGSGRASGSINKRGPAFCRGCVAPIPRQYPVSRRPVITARQGIDGHAILGILRAAEWPETPAGRPAEGPGPGQPAGSGPPGQCLRLPPIHLASAAAAQPSDACPGPCGPPARIRPISDGDARAGAASRWWSAPR